MRCFGRANFRLQLTVLKACGGNPSIKHVTSAHTTLFVVTQFQGMMRTYPQVLKKRMCYNCSRFTDRHESFWWKLPKPVMVMAPLANVTDPAFRRIIAKYGKPDVLWN